MTFVDDGDLEPDVPTNDYGEELREGETYGGFAYERLLTALNEAIVDEDIELTPHQKANKNLSNASFVLAVMAALTIIGISLAILFLILATWLTPEPYKQAKWEDDE